jgi:hypothetical protein
MLFCGLELFWNLQVVTDFVRHFRVTNHYRFLWFYKLISVTVFSGLVILFDSHKKLQNDYKAIFSIPYPVLLTSFSFTLPRFTTATLFLLQNRGNCVLLRVAVDTMLYKCHHSHWSSRCACSHAWDDNQDLYRCLQAVG